MELNNQKKSAVWLHFTPVSDVKAKCNLCKTIYSYRGGSVSNLRKHLKTKHGSVLIDEPATKKTRPTGKLNF